MRLSRRRQRGAGLPAWPGGPRSLRTAGWRERDRTLQEETPLAPAQTITSLILLPQNFLHWALDRRGRAACCSLSGVLRAGGTDGGGGGQGADPPAYSAWERPGASQRPCPGPAWSSSFAVTTGMDTELLAFPQTLPDLWDKAPFRCHTGQW